MIIVALQVSNLSNNFILNMFKSGNNIKEMFTTEARRTDFQKIKTRNSSNQDLPDNDQVQHLWTFYFDIFCLFLFPFWLESLESVAAASVEVWFGQIILWRSKDWSENLQSPTKPKRT